jgi:hypothetical protein
MNGKIATLLRSMCRNNDGSINKKEANILKKWWYKLSSQVKGIEHIKMLEKK